MYITINNYCIKAENIEEFYPCDILGNYQQNNNLTFIRHSDGTKGVYFLDYNELLALIKKAYH